MTRQRSELEAYEAVATDMSEQLAVLTSTATGGYWHLEAMRLQQELDAACLRNLDNSSKVAFLLLAVHQRQYVRFANQTYVIHALAVSIASQMIVWKSIFFWTA